MNNKILSNMKQGGYYMKPIKRMTSYLVLVTILTLIIGNLVYAQSVPFCDERDLCFVNTQGGNLNCRKGAGEEYEIVGKFKNGTELSWSIFLERDSQGRTWVGVSGIDINGKLISGYVLESYLRFERPECRTMNLPVYINFDMPDVG
jgi:hypothetical protein